ncbi:hypothetical protein OA492_00640 [Pelagibacteraceae bacterium]|nr:hypothetical protein [Pelagibacteraceae bacterium]
MSLNIPPDTFKYFIGGGDGSLSNITICSIFPNFFEFNIFFILTCDGSNRRWKPN